MVVFCCICVLFNLCMIFALKLDFIRLKKTVNNICLNFIFFYYSRFNCLCCWPLSKFRKKWSPNSPKTKEKFLLLSNHLYIKVCLIWPSSYTMFKVSWSQAMFVADTKLSLVRFHGDTKFLMPTVFLQNFANKFHAPSTFFNCVNR